MLTSVKPEAKGENCTQKSPLLFISFNPEVLRREHPGIASLSQSETGSTRQRCMAKAVLCVGRRQPGAAVALRSARCSLQHREGLKNR